MAMTAEIWLPQDVASRLREAAQTLQHLPMPKHGRPGTYRSTMPEPVVSFWEMWGGLTAAEREERRREFNYVRETPTPDQIARMDEALDWLLWINERDRKVVMAKAGGNPYRKISFFDGRSREYLRQIWHEGCDFIAGRLNKES